jgi:hypothetical protein
MSGTRRTGERRKGRARWTVSEEQPLPRWKRAMTRCREPQPRPASRSATSSALPRVAAVMRGYIRARRHRGGVHLGRPLAAQGRLDDCQSGTKAPVARVQDAEPHDPRPTMSRARHPLPATRHDYGRHLAPGRAWCQRHRARPAPPARRRQQPELARAARTPASAGSPPSPPRTPCSAFDSRDPRPPDSIPRTACAPADHAPHTSYCAFREPTMFLTCGKCATMCAPVTAQSVRFVRPELFSRKLTEHRDGEGA